MQARAEPAAAALLDHRRCRLPPPAHCTLPAVRSLPFIARAGTMESSEDRRKRLKAMSEAAQAGDGGAAGGVGGGMALANPLADDGKPTSSGPFTFFRRGRAGRSLSAVHVVPHPGAGLCRLVDVMREALLLTHRSPAHPGRLAAIRWEPWSARGQRSRTAARPRPQRRQRQLPRGTCGPRSRPRLGSSRARRLPRPGRARLRRSLRRRHACGRRRGLRPGRAGRHRVAHRQARRWAVSSSRGLEVPSRRRRRSSICSRARP